jgi:cell fate regulator YaaT (PSP1 superfamily)
LNEKQCEGCSEKPYYALKFTHSSETNICLSEEPLQKGSHVLAESRYGVDLARVLGPMRCTSAYNVDEAAVFIRTATSEDIQEYEKNSKKESEAFTICKERVIGLDLDMKLVSAHYLPEENKMLFFFTADNRVDFRELVRQLVSELKLRIELRQIGVRDESRIFGGVAVCGREYCCHGLTDKLTPVSIKMAKEQHLSLNSMKISGPCGRLLCCLSYEYDFYKEEKKNYPFEGSRINFGDESFRVQEVNFLSEKVMLVAKDGRHIAVHVSKFTRDGKFWKLLELPGEAD